MRAYKKRPGKRKRIPRGGYAPSSGRRSRPASMNDVIKSQIVSRAKRSKNPIEQAAVDALKAAAYNASVKFGGTVIEVLKDSVSQGSHKVAAKESNAKGTLKYESAGSGVVHKTEFSAGRPSSSIVNKTGKMNGTTKFTQYDTVTQFQDPTDRLDLSPISGFNQKGTNVFDTKSYWSMNDMYELTNITSYQRVMVKQQRTYWMTKHFGVEFKIMNQNKFFSSKVKVHWARQVIQSGNPKTLFNETFNPTLPTISTTSANTLPYDLQLTDLNSTSHISYCAIDPYNGSLSKAPNFRVNFEIVKTMTKVLGPGDIWNIDYKHHTGPGIVLEDLVQQKFSGDTDEKAAMFYFPIFEYVGPEVEAFESTNGLGQVSYIGTNPCALHFEMRKYAEIVKADASLISSYASAPAGGIAELKKWAFRTFTTEGPDDSINTINRRFNLAVDAILKDDEPTASGKYIIPVTTDQQTERGGRPNIS